MIAHKPVSLRYPAGCVGVIFVVDRRIFRISVRKGEQVDHFCGSDCREDWWIIVDVKQTVKYII